MIPLLFAAVLLFVLAAPVLARGPKVPSCSVAGYSAVGVNLPGSVHDSTTWPITWGWVLSATGAHGYAFGANDFPVAKGEFLSSISIIDQPEWYGLTADVYFGPRPAPYNESAAYTECSFVID